MRVRKYIVLLVLALAAAAAVWFFVGRGPRVNPNAEPGELRWMVKVGTGASGYVECDGQRVYCTGPHIWSLGRPRLYAYDTASGRKLWTYPTQWAPCFVKGVGILTGRDRSDRIEILDERTGDVRSSFDPPRKYTRITQRLDDNTVCLWGGDGLAAVDAKTGVPKWVSPCGTGTGSAVEYFSAFGDGNIYTLTDAGVVRAIDAQTGNEAWKTNVGKLIHDISAGNGAVYLHHGDNVLHALDSKTGQERWTYNTAASLENGLLAAGGRIYARTASTVICLRPEDGSEVWSVGKKSSSSWATRPAIRGGILYIGADNTLCAFDAATGTEKWCFQAEGNVMGTPVISGDTVYFIALVRRVRGYLHTGYLYAVAAEPEEPKTGPQMDAVKTSDQRREVN